MAERRKLLQAPPAVGPVDLPSDGTNDIIGAFLRGMIGDQDPGSLPAALGAVTPMLPLGKLWKLLKLKRPPSVGEPTNAADKWLRTHVVEPDLPAEFVPVGEEGVYNATKAVPPKKDPMEGVYQLQLEASAKENQAAKLRKPGEGPKRRRLYSGRPLDYDE